jgi:hypothetical protein
MIWAFYSSASRLLFVDAEKCLETAMRIDKMPEFIS